MDAVTPEQARSRSQLLASRYPAGADPSTDPPLTELLLDAGELVASLTCRLIAPAVEGEEVPASLVRTAVRAVVLKAEKMEVGERATARARTRAIGELRLREQHAGPWGESYFGPDEAAKAKMLDPDPTMHEALWALATPECRDAWLAIWGGAHAPAGVLIKFDYTRQRSY